MQVKPQERKASHFSFNVFLNAIVCNKRLIVFFLIALIAGCVFGYLINASLGLISKSSTALLVSDQKAILGDHNTGLQDTIYGIMGENINIPSNMVNGFNSNPDQIHIYINTSDYQRLEQVLAQLNAGMPATVDRAPATLRYGERQISVYLKLTDNLPYTENSHRWSLNVNLDGIETIFGMNAFTLCDPTDNGVIDKWVYQQALSKEGIDTVQYHLAQVVINDTDAGIFALEECSHDTAGDEEDVQYVQIRDSYNWSHDYEKQQLSLRLGMTSFDIGSSMPSRIYVYKIDSGRSGSNNKNDSAGKALLSQYINRSLNVSQAFDIDRLAKYEAISTLMGASPGASGNELRFYYNSSINRLEPVCAYLYAGSEIDDLSIEEVIYPFLDKDFLSVYLQELDRISSASYAESLNKNMAPGLKEIINTIHGHNPLFQYSPNFLRHNQNFIRMRLAPTRAVNAYYDNVSADGITLEIGSTQLFPVEILNLTYGAGSPVEYAPKNSTSVLMSRLLSDPVHYNRVEFNLPDNFSWSDGYRIEMKINYRLLGSTVTRSESVTPWARSLDNVQKDTLTSGFDGAGQT